MALSLRGVLAPGEPYAAGAHRVNPAVRVLAWRTRGPHPTRPRRLPATGRPGRGLDRPTRRRLGGPGPLHEAHVATIPFENLDILLGAPIRLQLGSVEAKLVGARRGGYCFEHNRLFMAVLEHLGYEVTSLAARVRLGATDLRPRTHMLLRVDLPGGPLLPMRRGAHSADPPRRGGRALGRPMGLPAAAGRRALGTPGPRERRLDRSVRLHPGAPLPRRLRDGQPLHEHLPAVAIRS